MNTKKLVILLLIILCLGLIFTACGKDYVKVTFFVDGVEQFSYFVDKGSYLEETPEVPSREGMTGVWSVTDFDEINSDLNVNAIYESNSYTITFLANDEVVTTVKLNKKNALSVVPEVPQKLGYSGVWNIIDFDKIRQDITVTAIYEITQYTINFFVGDEAFTTRYVEGGGGLTDVPTVPAFPNKNYSGKWMLNTGSLSAPVWTTPKFSNVVQNINVYAYYYITLDLRNIAKETTLTLDLDNEITAIDCGVKAGYDFIGWYGDAKFKEEIVLPCSFLGNKTLYARWVNNTFSEGFTFAGSKVTGYNGSENTIIIPYKDGENIITEIDSNAFENATFTSVTIPSTITKIGESSFRNCQALSTIIFSDGNNIAEIGNFAFYDCTSLSSYAFSEDTTTIAESAFYNCTSLTSLVNLSLTKITTIGQYAFYNCIKILQINLPSTLSEIMDSAFENATSAQFTFGNIGNLTKIGASAFKNCIKLVDINAPNLLTIGEGAFSNCRSLNTVTMVSTMNLYKLFGIDTDNSTLKFYEITDLVTNDIYFVPLSLRNVTIIGKKLSEGGVETLIPYALYNCYTIKNLTFANVINTIDSHAFYLDNNQVESGDIILRLPVGLKKINSEAFIKRNDLIYVDLPSTLESIGERAFYDLANLAIVNLATNSALKSVGKDAFSNCGWLTRAVGLVSLGRIVIGMSFDYAQANETLKASDFANKDTIAPYAFFGQTKLKSVILGDNILNINEFAFSACTVLESLEISPKCVNIGEGILSGCRAFNSLKVGGSVDIPSLFGKDSYIGSYKRGDYYLPISWAKLNIVLDSTTTTAIKNGIFSDYANLKEITIGEGYTVILDGAFKDNINLLKVNFPTTMLEIGATRYLEEVALPNEGVFANCPLLEEITFTSNAQLKYIRKNAFKNTNMKSLTVMGNVTLIEEDAFRNTKLETLNFVSKLGSTLVIEKFAFSDIATFGTSFILQLPAQLVTLGEGVFANNITLRKVILNNGLTNIGIDCFKNCDLRSFDLVGTVLLYEDEQTCLEEECLVNNILSGNNNIISLKLYKGIALKLLFGTIPNNLSKIEILGGEIIDSQFFNCTNIQEIIMLNVTKIGDYAFSGCNNISFKKVIVPQSVTSIGDYAFSDCTSLTAFSFSGNPTISSIGDYLFSGDVSLLEVIFPISVTNTTFEGVFKDCTLLNNTNIPNTLINIGDFTYYNANNLLSISIPESIVTIGDSAFENCYLMEVQNISFSSLKHIGNAAFKNCYLLRGIKAETIEEIGENAFDGCIDINEITIIEDAVSHYLSNVSSVVTINVSSYATAMDSDCFDGCVNLKMVVVHSVSNIESMLNILENQNMSEDVKIFVDINSYNNLSNDIKNSPLYASIYPNPCQFNAATYTYNESNFTAVLKSATYDKAVAFLPTFVYKGNIRYTVVEIGNSAFIGNTSLVQVIIPYTIEKIGKFAFQDCTNLQSVVIETGSKLITIDDYAFYTCTALKGFSLPNSVKYINTRVFSRCSNLENFVITYGSELISIGSYAFDYTSKLNQIAIKSELSSLGEYCFNYSGINSFSFGDKSVITQIKAYTFGYCYRLVESSVIMPECVIDIAPTAFFK